ncbi:hypothetical protein EVJ58_g4712 [Rhodofomes roseus]|uniref:Uncharacterized protein n=1 Tax=Rhodofomes roseus TaxID=34475 RepID=A0A4Y9YJI3_9APHY|nr:hypothetical protein EVJ58_g4712 [Rhodofomes roseus]
MHTSEYAYCLKLLLIDDSGVGSLVRVLSYSVHVLLLARVYPHLSDFIRAQAPGTRTRPSRPLALALQAPSSTAVPQPEGHSTCQAPPFVKIVSHVASDKRSEASATVRLAAPAPTSATVDVEMKRSNVGGISSASSSNNRCVSPQSGSGG